MGITALIRGVTTGDNICKVEGATRIQVLGFYMLIMASVNVLDSLATIGAKVKLFF